MESLISFFKELKYIDWGYLEAYRKFTKISHRKERPFLCPIRFSKQRHLTRRCTTAKFQSPIYKEAFTSPLYNGEILVSFIYRGILFAVVQRRDFSLLYI